MSIFINKLSCFSFCRIISWKCHLAWKFSTLLNSFATSWCMQYHLQTNIKSSEKRINLPKESHRVLNDWSYGWLNVQSLCPIGSHMTVILQMILVMRSIDWCGITLELSFSVGYKFQSLMILVVLLEIIYRVSSLWYCYCNWPTST